MTHARWDVHISMIVISHPIPCDCILYFLIWFIRITSFSQTCDCHIDVVRNMKIFFHNHALTNLYTCLLVISKSSLRERNGHWSMKIWISTGQLPTCNNHHKTLHKKKRFSRLLEYKGKFKTHVSPMFYVGRRARQFFQAARQQTPWKILFAEACKKFTVGRNIWFSRRDRNFSTFGQVSSLPFC